MADFQGIIVIHKEKGFTSHDVVAKLRGILHMKKIGHTGTAYVFCSEGKWKETLRAG